MSRPVVASLAVIVVVVALATGARAQTIVEIDVRENSKTTDATVIQIAQIETGDTWSEDLRTQATERLVNSGLFKDVLVAPEMAPNGTRVVIVAQDKHSWAVAPTYYNQPTNQGGGFGFGENNLLGKNKKVLLYGQIATGDTFFIGAYVDPSLAGTRWRWQYDVWLRTARFFEYASPVEYAADMPAVRESRLDYLNNGLRLGLWVMRGLTLDGRLRGARVSFRDVRLADGATLADVTDDPAATEVPTPGAEGWDVSGELMAQLDTRSNWYGITRGTRIRASFEQGLPALGSDFDYWYANGAIDHALGLYEKHTLDLRLRVGHGKNLPFQQEYTAGGTGLRGLLNDQMRGDTKVSGNVEYSLELFEVKGFALRGLAFLDVAYLTFLDADNPQRNYLPRAEARGADPLKTSIGVGTRVYLRQIVLPLLGVDLGYSPERNAFELYLAVGLTDV